MNKTDQILIRACKSTNPRQRLLSVFRRFYLHTSKPERHLIVVLSRICDEYCPFNTSDLVEKLSPQNRWMYVDGSDFYSACIGVLITKIRLTKAIKFPGLTAPAFFRNKEANKP